MFHGMFIGSPSVYKTTPNHVCALTSVSVRWQTTSPKNWPLAALRTSVARVAWRIGTAAPR
jgi:hypothetical protein